VVIYGYVNLLTFFNASGTIGIVIFSVIVAIVCIILITSIMGLIGTYALILGSCNDNVCALILYVIILIAWMLFFIGIGVSVYIVLPKFIGEDCKSN
jgi:hypothetical protein